MVVALWHCIERSFEGLTLLLSVLHAPAAVTFPQKVFKVTFSLSDFCFTLVGSSFCFLTFRRQGLGISSVNDISNTSVMLS